MKKNDRRLDLSTKFLKMGQSLISEGREEGDIGIAQVGSMMVFMGGLIISGDEDIFKFSELCSMFSSKRILDEMNLADEIGRVDESKYDEIIKNLNRLRGKDDEDGKKSDK
jgi:hypothetical protein